MPALGVNGATPYAQGSNHPTAHNHSHRDVSSYDARRQTRVKCTYCGCWAQKGALCYQCKQPTGPLVLPRRNGYRVEPLVGGNSVRKNANSLDDPPSSMCFSPRQRERMADLSAGRFRSASSASAFGGASPSRSSAFGGVDASSIHHRSVSSSAAGGGGAAGSSSGIVVVGRTSSARPPLSVYDGAVAAMRQHQEGGPLSSTSAAAVVFSPERAITPRSHSARNDRYAIQQHQLYLGGESAGADVSGNGSAAAAGNAASASSAYVGGKPARRYYAHTPAAPTAAGQLVSHLRDNVIARQEAALAGERRLRAAAAVAEGAAPSSAGGGLGNGGRSLPPAIAELYASPGFEEDEVYGYYSARRERAAAMEAAMYAAEEEERRAAASSARRAGGANRSHSSMPKSATVVDGSPLSTGRGAGADSSAENHSGTALFGVTPMRRGAEASRTASASSPRSPTNTHSIASINPYNRYGHRSLSSPFSAAAARTGAVRGSHKGVTGGFFYHEEQTAKGHKFREESAYEPSRQTKMKCSYCGCWAPKNAPCGLCKTVNKGF